MTVILRADTTLRSPLPDTPTLEVPDFETGLEFGLRASDLAGMEDGQEVTSWVSERGSANLARRTFNRRLVLPGVEVGYPTYDATGGPGGTPAVRFDPGVAPNGSMIANFNLTSPVSANPFPVIASPFTYGVLIRVNEWPSYSLGVARVFGSQTGALANLNPRSSRQFIMHGTTSGSGKTISSTPLVEPGVYLPVVAVFDGAQSRLHAGRWVGHGAVDEDTQLSGVTLGRSQAGTDGKSLDSTYVEACLWSRSLTEVDVAAWFDHLEETYPGLTI